MVRAFSKFPKKPADWVSPSAPLAMRKQVYLPEFTITLIRTPFLPPRYATFYVPLNFNKLDMRDYMQRVYGVGVISVRSYVEQQKPTRHLSMSRRARQHLRRPESKKKMTIEMKQPFVWPEEPKDTKAWERDQFHNVAEYQQSIANEQQDPFYTRKEKTAEIAEYSEEAKKLLDGSKAWRPTWQALGLKYDRPVVGPRKGSGTPSDS